MELIATTGYSSTCWLFGAPARPSALLDAGAATDDDDDDDDAAVGEVGWWTSEQRMEMVSRSGH